MVERDNIEFVDAIHFESIEAYGSRKGKIKFTHLDGRITWMSFKHFMQITDSMVKGWLIGRFTYTTYYNAFGIECLEVLV